MRIYLHIYTSTHLHIKHKAYCNRDHWQHLQEPLKKFVHVQDITRSPPPRIAGRVGFPSRNDTRNFLRGFIVAMQLSSVCMLLR